MLSSATVQFAQTAGVQKVTHFEEQPNVTLVLSELTPGNVGLAAALIQTNEEGPS